MEEPTQASKKPGINEVDSLQPEAPWTSMQQTESATQAGGVRRRAGTSLFRNERAGAASWASEKLRQLHQAAPVRSWGVGEPSTVTCSEGTGEQGDFDPAAWSSTRVGGYLGCQRKQPWTLQSSAPHHH